MYQPIDLSASAYAASLGAIGSTIASPGPRPSSAPSASTHSGAGLNTSTSTNLFAVRKVPETILSHENPSVRISASTNIQSPVLSSRQKVPLAGSKLAKQVAEQQQLQQQQQQRVSGENQDANGSYFLSPVRQQQKQQQQQHNHANNANSTRATRPSTTITSSTITTNTAAVATPDSVIRREHVPEALSNTLDHIVAQLDIMTKTMTILEQRLSATEDRVSSVVAFTRDMLNTQKQQQQQQQQQQQPQQSIVEQASVQSFAATSPIRTSITIKPSSPLVSASSTIHSFHNIAADNESRSLVASALQAIPSGNGSASASASRAAATSGRVDGFDEIVADLEQEPIVAGHFDECSSDDDDDENDDVGFVGSKGVSGAWTNGQQTNSWDKPYADLVNANHYDSADQEDDEDDDDDSAHYTEDYENETE